MRTEYATAPATCCFVSMLAVTAAVSAEETGYSQLLTIFMNLS
jgi:hypothetical protein